MSTNFNFAADSIDLRQNELRRLTETWSRYYGLLTTYLLDVPILSAINGVNLTVVSRGSATLKKFRTRKFVQYRKSKENINGYPQ